MYTEICIQAHSHNIIARFLSLTELPSFSTHRLHLKLSLVYKIVSRLCYFLPTFFSRNSEYTYSKRLRGHFQTIFKNAVAIDPARSQ